MANFSSRIPDCDSHSPALLDLFLSSNPGICTRIVFLPSGDLDHVVVLVSIEFPSHSKRDAPFHRTALSSFKRCSMGGNL